MNAENKDIQLAFASMINGMGVGNTLEICHQIMPENNIEHKGDTYQLTKNEDVFTFKSEEDIESYVRDKFTLGSFDKNIIIKYVQTYIAIEDIFSESDINEYVKETYSPALFDRRDIINYVKECFSVGDIFSESDITEYATDELSPDIFSSRTLIAFVKDNNDMNDLYDEEDITSFVKDNCPIEDVFSKSEITEYVNENLPELFSKQQMISCLTENNEYLVFENKDESVVKYVRDILDYHFITKEDYTNLTQGVKKINYFYDLHSPLKNKINSGVVQANSLAEAEQVAMEKITKYFDEINEKLGEDAMSYDFTYLTVDTMP